VIGLAVLGLMAVMTCQAPAVGLAPPALASLLPSARRQESDARERIAEIRVHGNLIVPTDQVISLAGANVGDPFGPTTLEDVTARLRASKQFDQVEVLKRFASIEDASRIALVIIVNEGPVRLTSGSGGFTIVRRRGLRNLMFLPVLEAEDGYGVTYGARLALAGAAGPRSRVSFPLTWGGRKEAGVELDRPLARGPFTRVLAGATLHRRRNPAFLENDDRGEVRGRAERASGPLRAGATLGWQHVSFAGTRDTFWSAGGDVAFDTRRDPVLPRNAVLATASWERLTFGSGGSVQRSRLEGRGYLGLIGQHVLAVRVLRESASGPLPPYLKSLLGGWSNLRGFRAGALAGDTLLAGSLELRVPLSSPLQLVKLGASVFLDAGTAYDAGQQLRDQTLRRGIGVGIWATATVFHIGVSVAHGQGADTRVNFGGGLSF
jgi:outer membrane protein assembly factor BamA